MAAAGRQGRAERLNERLRGAQRTNVADESFSLNIEGLDAPSPARRTPSSAARKRKRDDGAQVADAAPASAPKDPYGLPDTSKESPGQPPTARAPGRQDGLSSSRRAARSASRVGSAAARPADEAADELLEALPAPASTSSPVRSRVSRSVLDEVEESPAHAPGSGRRRNVALGAAVGSAARLQRAVSSDDTAPQSLPLAQKARRSDSAASVRSRTPMASLSRRSADEELDELSPDRPPDPPADVDLSDTRPASAEPGPETAPQQHRGAVSEDEAEEIDAVKAAKALGRKRPRRSLRTSSPELGSGAPEADDADAQPAPRRTRRRPAKSPAAQKHPVRKPRAKPRKQPPREKRRRKPDKAAASRRHGDGQGDDEEDDAIEITVQRFINNKRRAGDDDADPLQTEIPFANRSGESVVDVLAQVCDEVTAATLAQLGQLADAADGAAKKECRIKMRAVEAYRAELRARLLQHAIHLNHWYSLRKQVRQAQKEKLALRDEIVRLRGEREQVALRMDAVRIKHEAANKEATHRINTSTLMHDVDLAVEQGRAAPELAGGAQREADLANLELLVARVAEQASSASATGGLLRQVTEFNAFLERATLALESR